MSDRNYSNTLRAALLVLSAVTLLDGPASAAASPAAAPAAGHTVVMRSFMFAPTQLTVPVGTTVVWRNLDGEPHTTVSIDGVFRSQALDQNDSYSYRFTKPGTYQFICSIHPQMRGTIIVTAG